MNTRAWLWAFLGIPGLREIVLVALVALVLYGRSGLQIARRGRGLASLLSPARRVSPSASASRARAGAPTTTQTHGILRSGDRVFWFLAILAAAAVAAWVATRTLIVSAPELSH
jgi:hypothetical protein